MTFIFPPSSRQISAGSLVSASLSPIPVSPESFTASSITKAMANVEIPALLESVETYVFLGFTQKRADSMWWRYRNQPEDMDADFMEFAHWAIENDEIPDVESSSDDWDLCMRTVGIGKRLREAILLAEFEDIRYTATCKFWLHDAIDIAYGTLVHLNDRLKQNAPLVDYKNKRDDRGKSLPPTEVNLISRTSVNHLQSLTIEPNPPHPKGNLTETPTPLAVTATNPPQELDMCTTIWRAGSRLKCEAFYDEMTQRIEMRAIHTTSGDFNGISKVGYWTPQKETADRYAQWAKHKCDISEIAILQVSVPDSLTRTLSVGYLWFSDVWKNVVWLCHNERYVPKEITEYEGKDLLIGHIASGKHRKYQAIKDYREIKESDVLTISVAGERQKAIQWVFKTREAVANFEEQCRGRVVIHRLGSHVVPPKDSK